MTVDLDKLEALIGAYDAALEKLRSTFVNDDDEWEAAWREVRDAEHIIRNFMFAKSASIAAELRARQELTEALWQCVDDMAEDGHCVCPATKQHAIEVLKKWEPSP